MAGQQFPAQPQVVWYTFPPWPGPNPPLSVAPVPSHFPLYLGPWSPYQHLQAQSYLEQMRIQYCQNLVAYQIQNQQMQNFSAQIDTLRNETDILITKVENHNSSVQKLLEQLQSAPFDVMQLIDQLTNQQNKAQELAEQVDADIFSSFCDIEPLGQLLQHLNSEIELVPKLVLDIQNLQFQPPSLNQHVIFQGCCLLERLQLRQLHIYMFQAGLFMRLLNNQIFQNRRLPEQQVNYPGQQLAQETSRDLDQQQSEAKDLLFKLIHEMEWHLALNGEFRKPYFAKVLEFVRRERELYPEEVYPESDEVYTWMRYCTVKPRTVPFNWIEGTTDVKVVILGQDPYPTSGHAHGLAFSCRETIPKSLRRIFEALDLDKDVGFTNPGHGNLTSWAKQGVLLLNTVLTVRTTGEIKDEVDCNCDLDSEFVFGNAPHSSGYVSSTSVATSGYVASTSQKKKKAKKPNSHSKCVKKQNRRSMQEWGGVGWETFTDAVIKYISDNSEGVVFMLWGGFAHKKEKLIDEKRHLILKTCHPAAPCKKHYEKFLSCMHFSTANLYLKSKGSDPIIWNA